MQILGLQLVPIIICGQNVPWHACLWQSLIEKLANTYYDISDEERE